jgi:cell wall-associated NlpC family hydrolase
MPRPSNLPARPALAAGLLLAAVLLTGCRSSRPPATLEGETKTQWTASDVHARLDSAAAQWKGTPHEWGSASPSGVDCSGLVQSVFADAFQLSVPRSTEQQARVGRVVSREALRPGDLVFFRTAPKTRHVGIYLSDGDFLHASSSEGVTVSPLDRSYWTDHWWHARRLLRFSDAASSSEPDPDSPQPPPASAKIGW